MQPKPGTTIIDGEIATHWIDENGILCSVVKRVPFTIERMEANFKLIAEITGNKRVCAMSDLTFALPVDKPARMYASGVIAEYYKALALLTPSPFARMIGNVFIALSDTPIPTKQFAEAEEGIEWLKGYSDK